MSFRQLLAGLVSLALFPATAILAYQDWRFSVMGARATGRVVQLDAGPAHPRIVFPLPDGTQITFVGSGAVFAKVGDSVPVIYDPSSPDNTALIASFGSVYFAPGILGLIALGGAAAFFGSERKA